MRLLSQFMTDISMNPGAEEGLQMIARIRIGLVGVLLLPVAAHGDPKTYQQLVASTGWIIAPREKNTTAGTCWLVHKADRLVVTAAHLVLDTPDVLVYFPSRENDEIMGESGRYLREQPAIGGRVVLVDPDCDLAVIQLESLAAKGDALRLAARSARPGESVHSIGNSGSASQLAEGILWRYTRGNVRQVFEQKLGPRGARKIRMVESQSPINEGDSGGAVVNDAGEVVGVVSFYKPDEQLVSYNVDVHEVKAFLERAAKKLRPDAAEKTPPPDRAAIIGEWTFRTQDKEGNTAAGASTFHGDGTYLFGAESDADTEDPPQRGRFTYANGMLWLISEDGLAAFPLTWSSRDRFTSRIHAIEFHFERGPKK